jgi:hypothetical protein
MDIKYGNLQLKTSRGILPGSHKKYCGYVIVEEKN